jgi:hypothetical protein
MGAGSDYDVHWRYVTVPKTVTVYAVTELEAEEVALQQIPPAPDGMRIITYTYPALGNPDQEEDTTD